MREALADAEAVAALLSKLGREAAVKGDLDRAQALIAASNLIASLGKVGVEAGRVGRPGGYLKALATDGYRFLVYPGYAALRPDPRLRVFAWLHEALHILYAHPWRAALVEDPELFGLIADVAVNTRAAELLGLQRVPEPLVDAPSLPGFVERALERKLSPEARRIIAEAARLLASGEATVEEVYRLIAGSREASEALKEAFAAAGGAETARCAAPGGALGAPGSASAAPPQRRSGGEGDGERRGDARRPQAQQRGPEKKGGEGEAEASRGVEGYARLLAEAARAAERSLSLLSRSRGTAAALRLSPGARERSGGLGLGLGPPGSVLGFDVVELRRLALAARLARLIEGEVARAVKDRWHNYSSPGEDGYWLPGEEEELRASVLAAVDVSGSTRLWHRLFVRMVYDAARRAGAKLRVAYFADDLLQVGDAEDPSRAGARLAVPLGGGTWLGPRFARMVSELDPSETPIIVVTSDFLIEVRDPAYTQLKLYRSRGGRVVCVAAGAPGGAARMICDRLLEAPTVFSARARRA